MSEEIGSSPKNKELPHGAFTSFNVQPLTIMADDDEASSIKHTKSGLPSLNFGKLTPVIDEDRAGEDAITQRLETPHISDCKQESTAV